MAVVAYGRLSVHLPSQQPVRGSRALHTFAQSRAPSHPLFGLLLVPLGPEDVDEPLAFGVEEHHQLIGYDPAECARGSQLGLRCCRGRRTSQHMSTTQAQREEDECSCIYLL